MKSESADLKQAASSANEETALLKTGKRGTVDTNAESGGKGPAEEEVKSPNNKVSITLQACA